ncbi:8156_t:CDS:2, partial [Funneliformis caledonium]
HPSENVIEEIITTTLESPTDEGYNDGYEEVKHEIEIPPWITSLSEEQRAEFAFQLLLTLPTPKIAQLHIRLSPLFHRDFLALLPYELAIHILSFLNAQTLGRAARVSKQWRKVSSDGSLWRNLFFRNDLRYPSTNQVNSFSKSNDGSNSQQQELSQNLDVWDDVLPHSRTTISQSSINIPSAIPSTSLSTISAPISDTSFSKSRVSPRSTNIPCSLHHSTSSIQSSPVPAHFTFFPSVYIPYNLPNHQNESGQPVINWKHLFHQRSLIEHHWRKGIYSIRELPGHNESIYCIQFDEHKIISGSRDDTIKIWDIKTGHCVKTYRGHKQSVLCLQYDDKVIVSGSSDTTIIIWDLVTGEIIRTLEGHSESVLNLRFDDNLIISCSKDRTVRIWDREIGTCLRVLNGHRAAVNAVQFKDGYVISASGDRTIKLWSLSTGQCLRTFDGHSRGIACIQFDGNIIVSGSSDKTIKVFDVHTGACSSTLVGHTDLVRTLQFDKNKIVSGSYDETLKVWDPKTGELLSNLIHGHTSRVFKLQFNSTKIVSCSQDQKIIIWDFANNVDTTFLV